jgi:hypothetical protein
MAPLMANQLTNTVLRTDMANLPTMSPPGLRTGSIAVPSLTCERTLPCARPHPGVVGPICRLA